MPKGPMKFDESLKGLFVAWPCVKGETGKQLQAMFAHFQFSKKKNFKLVESLKSIDDVK